eukprot:TRINITY_DN1650_c0_g1_i1.p1 TRINITY_DN1650_c0_g1~~TRINITY_DN1650_c0_g1_i1.p1  ORF type:complete len:191 (+),score=46.28 TRINITY_DN1650_c0_g1_i1:324-896(+)
MNRRHQDIMKLVLAGYEVDTIEDEALKVSFRGPVDTPYEKGIFFVRIELPNNYPYRSPSVQFLTHIFHPNIDFKSGAVCLNVLNQTWTPMYDLNNIFETFLPQLLRYPNPTDPMNLEAARMMLNKPELFNQKATETVLRYASVLESPEKRSKFSKLKNNTESSNSVEAAGLGSLIASSPSSPALSDLSDV